MEAEVLAVGGVWRGDSSDRYLGSWVAAEDGTFVLPMVPGLTTYDAVVPVLDAGYMSPADWVRLHGAGDDIEARARAMQAFRTPTRSDADPGGYREQVFRVLVGPKGAYRPKRD